MFAQDSLLSTEEQISIIRYEMLDASMKVASIEVDKNNTIWFCTNSGIHKIVSIQKQPQSYLPGIDIKDVVIDRKGNAYAAGEKSFYEVESGIEINLPSSTALINDIDYYQGRIWIATTEGIFTYRLSNQKFAHFTEKNSKLKSNSVNFINVDSRGKMWIGTDNGSIEVEGDKWRGDFKGEKMIVSRENDEGQWFITNQDMYIISKFGRLISVGLDEQLYKGELNDFVIDSKGRIYFASDILVRYNPYTEEIESYADDAGLISKKCISLACDKNDNIWIGTQDGGLFRILFADILAEQLSASVIIDTKISCHNEEQGKLSVSVSGGKRPYKYQWNKPGVYGKRPSSLAPGEYTVTVTDKVGANYVASVNLVNPEPLKIEVVATTKVTGLNKDDGTADIAVTGGKPPYVANWSGGKKGFRVGKLKPGPHKVVVTDNAGCTTERYVEIKKDKFIPELDITKVNIGQTLRINELYFDADSSAVKLESYEVLDEVYEFLAENKNVVIEIGGHTNTIPPHEYCDKLSTARARNVAEYLYYKGIEKDRIAYKGYGKRQPLANVESMSARRKNQRVEIKILSVGK